MLYVASPALPLLVESRHQALLPSTVDSRYCGHPWGEELVSVIAAGVSLETYEIICNYPREAF